MKSWPLALCLTWMPITGWALGCSHDEDCQGVERCQFALGRTLGECAEWNPPLDESEHSAIQSGKTSITKGGNGYPCQLHVDCLPGYRCFKPPSHFDGQCLLAPLNETDH
ncbi:hypothetical protein CCP4SC76_5580007 [Gammaproteobacteria bacterium]